MLIVPDLEDGTVLAIEDNDGRCMLTSSDTHLEASTAMKKRFKLEELYSFLGLAYKEYFNVQFGDAARMLVKYV